MVFGVIPVAVLGLAFYVVAVPLFSPWAWRVKRREVHLVRLGSMVVGMGFVMYLIYAELYQIGQVCEYCTGVHIVTFLLFCITVFSAAIWGLGGKPGAGRPRLTCYQRGYLAHMTLCSCSPAWPGRGHFPQ